MKHLFILLIIISFETSASLENCINDARDSGYQINERPAPDCLSVIKNHPSRIETKSLQGNFHTIAYGNILYLNTLSSSSNAIPIKVEMLAGDQTGLTDISKVWIHEKKKKFLVLQNGSPKELLSFTLEYASNTAPLRHLKSSVLNNVSKIKLLDNTDEIALMYRSTQSIKFINEGADNVRYKGPGFKPVLIREISGENSKLNNPTDVAISKIKNEIYVLDSSRVLIFDLNSPKDAVPKNLITQNNVLKDVIAIELTEDSSLIGQTKNGDTIKLITNSPD